MTKSLFGKVSKVFNQGPPTSAVRRQRLAYSPALFSSSRQTMLEAMGAQGTLYAIVQLLSTGKHATGPWRLYRKSFDNRRRYASGDQGSDQRIEVLQHQALRLWNQPNDFMTGSQFREIGWQHMELAGEWYWVMNRGPSGKSIPIEMWPVRPDRMEPVPSADNFLAGWVYTDPNGEAVPLSVDEVIQLRYPHPTDPYRGLSPVQALLADIDSARYTAQWSRNFFLNAAEPGGIVTFSKRLTDEEFTEFTDRWREQHQGVARGHRVGVLEQGATWQSNTYSIQEMQFPELRRVTSDMIRQGYRIHQAMLGDSTDVNRANAQTALEIHVAFHEIPRYDREKDVLNTRYLEMFKAQDSVEFDYPDPFPPNRQEDLAELKTKSDAAKILIECGFEPHAVLEVVGLPDMEFPEPEPPPPPVVVPGQVLPGQETPALEAAPAGAGGETSAPPVQSGTSSSAPENSLRELEAVDIIKIIRETFADRRSNGHKELNV